MSKKTLIIVESAAKARTIKKFLSNNYQVQASNGHLIDLPRSKLGIDIDNNFAPRYITIRGKGEILKSLRTASKKARRVLLATDPDREGEAICWHLEQALKIENEQANRIQFNEITKGAIASAIKDPRQIDKNRVDAQQTRRILDRIVGYQISPLLWKKVKKGLSAGRVQSVALSLICDREVEIDIFVPEEYWTVEAVLEGKEKKEFTAALTARGKEKISIPDAELAGRIVEELNGYEYKIEKITKKQVERKPPPPFITSSMQQEASGKSGFTTKKTMQLAQQLYEGVDLGNEGTVGLVTYIRTDSVKISDVAREEAVSYITEQFGPEFLPAKPHEFKSRKGAQEAHEAIRPTSLEREPGQVKEFLGRDQYRLYELIWKRFLASQMASVVLDQVRVDIKAGDYTLRATGSTVRFPGFQHIYRKDKKKGEDEKKLPVLEEGEVLVLKGINPGQHFTQPPPRYNEASLVKELEEKGIGRPSTYSPIIETIRSRGYVILEKKTIYPTELGKLVLALLKEYFPEIINVEFTARLEEKLDHVEQGSLKGLEVLEDFYQSFRGRLEVAEEQMESIELEPEYSDESCPQCERTLVYKLSKFGRFLACPGFPECRYTKNIVTGTGVKCPRDGGEMVEKRTRRGRLFYSCENYPDCEYSMWQKPLPEKNCPRCGGLMAEGGKDKVAVCADAECRKAAKAEQEAEVEGRVEIHA